MENVEKNQVLQTLIGYLDEDKWSYNVDVDSITASVLINKAYPTVNLQIVAKDTSYDIFVSSGRKVNEEDKVSVMEFLTRANNILARGLFQFDIDKGEYRFKSYYDCHENVFSKDQFVASIVKPVLFFCRYDSWIGKVISGELTASEAALKAEDMSLAMLFSKDK